MLGHAQWQIGRISLAVENPGFFFFGARFVAERSCTFVFLHIAPERAREDQNLTTGPHFSAGHAQWRYALAT
jgi:hypothetical protein